MINAGQIVDAAPKYLGTAYDKLDCQAFIEACLLDAGLRKDLAGSNTWYRYIREHGWVGTPEECRKKYGRIPKGAFLFILDRNGKEPEKFRADGLGNASHIGLYTGMTGDAMVKKGLADGAKIQFLEVDYGDGAMHSSASRGMVCTSKFKGKTIQGGWNMVGLWDQIDYGVSPDGDSATLPGGEKGKKMQATVSLPAGVDGSTVNIRERQSTASGLVERVPVGAEIEVIENLGEWCQVKYGKRSGYMMTKYLQFSEDGTAPAAGTSGTSYTFDAGAAPAAGDVVTWEERQKIENALKEIERQMEIIRATLGRG